MKKDKILQYDFVALTQVCPELKPFIILAPNGHDTIDFSDPAAVRALNKAILMSDYQLDYWSIPEGKLVPAIPGRWLYIEKLKALFEKENTSKKNSKKHILDIGVGANCIYPLLAHKRYGWTCVGSDIEQISLDNAASILKKNGIYKESIQLKIQKNSSSIFHSIIESDDYYDAVICNPPFYDSISDPQLANKKKNKNLNQVINRNFGGEFHEIACMGGELDFISRMITESTYYKNQVYWFSCLVSKEKNLVKLFKLLHGVTPSIYNTFSIDTANKKARVLYWSFLTKKQRSAWENWRWS